MSRIILWIAFTLAIISYSTLAVLLFRRQGRRAAVILLAGALVAIELLVTVIRLRAQGSPFAWEEPLWVSMIAVALPMLAGAILAGWSAQRDLSVFAQVSLTAAAATVAFFGGVSAMYAYLTLR